MPEQELKLLFYFLIVLGILSAGGGYYRNKSYKRLFDSLRAKGKIGDYAGPEYLWGETERHLSGIDGKGNTISGPISQLKTIQDLVSIDEMSDNEIRYIKNFKLGHFLMYPYVIGFIFFLGLAVFGSNG